MKKILFSIFLVLCILHANAQWISTGTNVYNSNSGYIGIGTSSPISKLTVDGGDNLSDGLSVKGTNAPMINLTNSTYSLQFGLATSASYYSPLAQQGDAVLRFLSTSASAGNLIMAVQGGDFKFTTYNNGSTDNIQMIIKQGGDIGIGTSSPQAKLDVIGGIRSKSNIVYGSGILANFTNATDQDINFTVSSPGAADKSTLVAPSTQTNLAFGIGATEKMRINSAGNLLIGQSSQVNTNYKLDVAGSVRANAITVIHQGPILYSIKIID